MKKSPENEQQRNLVEAEGTAVLGDMHGALGTTRVRANLGCIYLPRSREGLPYSRRAPWRGYVETNNAQQNGYGERGKVDRSAYVTKTDGGPYVGTPTGALCRLATRIFVPTPTDGSKLSRRAASLPVGLE